MTHIRAYRQEEAEALKAVQLAQAHYEDVKARREAKEVELGIRQAPQTQEVKAESSESKEDKDSRKKVKYR